jgi:alkanesulfonate monooxygenase SsuD/methylene tetrahydromethanopterin reductase-like flavin-dependent oxidoreductase (luciferase family)
MPQLIALALAGAGLAAGYKWVSRKVSEHIEAERARADYRNMTMADVEKQANNMPWGSPDEVIAKLTGMADRAGAGTLLISMNRGSMPQDMFLGQIRRFARDVLPALQAYNVKASPFAKAA